MPPSKGPVYVIDNGKSWSVIARHDFPGWEAEIRDQGHRRGFVIRIRRTNQPPSRSLRTAPGVLRKEARELAAQGIEDVATTFALPPEGGEQKDSGQRVPRISLKGARCVVVASERTNTASLERAIRNFGWLPSRVDIAPRTGNLSVRSIEQRIV